MAQKISLLLTVWLNERQRRRNVSLIKNSKMPLKTENCPFTGAFDPAAKQPKNVQSI